VNSKITKQSPKKKDKKRTETDKKIHYFGSCSCSVLFFCNFEKYSGSLPVPKIVKISILVSVLKVVFGSGC